MSDAIVYIVDDEPAVRDSLAMLISSVGLTPKTFANAREFLAGYSPSAPGCLVTDVRMPGMSGLELQQHLAEKRIALPVVVITGHGDIAMAVRAMKAGAADFIEKPFNDQRLIDAVQQALRQPSMAVAGEADVAAIEARLESLTPREREIMMLIVEGHPNKVVAARLGLSIRTVESHRAKVMEKAEARSLAELVRMAMAVKLVER